MQETKKGADVRGEGGGEIEEEGVEEGEKVVEEGL